MTDYQWSKVILEKKYCGTCKWYRLTDFKTNELSRFRKRVYGPGRGTQKVCYRVKTPMTENFRTTRSNVLCIVKL